ncbi:hypothetical protein, partial [Dubosiella newyorkensis]|uniref:hypothetical protein n=5 Tax=Dubosiella newyorkensis TaxID=1862672 RepID=UPI0023544E63
MAKRQKSNRNREESYAQRRQKLTEIQYEHLVERHVIRPSNSHYKVLEDYAHKANNVYNQALYRVRQALFKGSWMTYSQLDKSLKKSRDQKDCMIYSSMNWYYVKFEDNLNFCFLTNPKKFVPLSIDYGSLS